jgi:polysaccharide export outer membrane protein
MSKGIRVAILVAAPALCGAMQTEPAAQTPPPVAQEALPKSTSTAAPDAGASTPAAPVDDKVFLIGAEDQLMITVWGDNRIGGQVLVRPDGRISLDLLGEVQAAGRTPLDLGSDIAELLKQKDILRRPQVTVKVTQVNSKKYRINGEVMKTGAFPLVVATRVMDALVEAGGFKDFANKKDIVIMRGTQRLKFNWNDAVKGKNPEQNVYLQHGDIIIVK